MTRLILPYTRPEILPLRRAAMPTQSAGSVLRPGYRLVPVNRPNLPPHYHITLDARIENGQLVRAPEDRVRRPGDGEQAMISGVPRSLLSCADAECTWYLAGHEGIDAGAPFKHPQGVECGDFVGCTDDNCPCPDRVTEWPNGDTRGHIVPCPFCDDTFRFALRQFEAPKQVGISEYVDRLAEGADALITIRKRGL